MKKVFLDTECYKNYFLVCFKTEEGKRAYFEIFNDNRSSFDIDKIYSILERYQTIGFNSLKYDIPMLISALNGKSNLRLKYVSDSLIQDSWYNTCKNNDLFKPKNWEHIDIIEPAPAVGVGLKMYGARLHVDKLQDLPIEPDSIIENKDIELLRKYCFNDVDITESLYRSIQDRIELREKMSKIYNIDLRSKSDAQIAEALINSQLSIDKKSIAKTDFYQVCRYRKPVYINFSNNQLDLLLVDIMTTDFVVDNKGTLTYPDILLNKKIDIGQSSYSIGIGGLHSTEKERSIVCADDEILLDIDVTSYYPSIILNNNYYPEHLGKKFLSLYRSIFESRIEAKKSGDKLKSEIYKIILNGSFGKFGSIYSSLYSPELLLSTTITGQLCILMLIEQLELNNIKVVSANTDGIMCYIKRYDINKVYSTLEKWEKLTGFSTEKVEYRALYNKSVNSYIAIGDKVKCKGIYAQDGLSKNPILTICLKAIVAYLKDGIDIETTILSGKNIEDYLVTRKVKEGAIWKGEYLGKVIRWYYSVIGEPIYTKDKKDKVAMSDRAIPIMELSKDKPSNLDYSGYIDIAYQMLYELGIRIRGKHNLNLFEHYE